MNKDFVRELGDSLLWWEGVPGYRFLDPKYYKSRRIVTDFIEMLRHKFYSHYKDFDQNVIRDFCDTVIAAKIEAQREGKESAPYLTDENLAMAIFDLFSVGTEMNQTTFRWMLFHMLNDKQIERKLRQEVEEVIGDRIPTHEDRNRCDYAMAFISEVIRQGNINPIGVPHKAVVTSKVGK